MADAFLEADDLIPIIGSVPSSSSQVAFSQSCARFVILKAGVPHLISKIEMVRLAQLHTVSNHTS
jgi:hypothetical protein